MSPQAFPSRFASGGGDIGIKVTEQFVLPPAFERMIGDFPSSAMNTPISKRWFAFDRRSRLRSSVTDVPAAHDVTPLLTVTLARSMSFAVHPRSLPLRSAAHMSAGNGWAAAGITADMLTSAGRINDANARDTLTVPSAKGTHRLNRAAPVGTESRALRA